MTFEMFITALGVGAMLVLVGVCVALPLLGFLFMLTDKRKK